MYAANFGEIIFIYFGGGGGGGRREGVGGEM